MVASDGSQYVQKSEYDKVKQENYELHTKIFNLTANQQTLHDTIKNRDEIILARDKTIEELQKENNLLKIRIKELEDKIDKLELDNKSLNKKMNVLERDNEILKKDNNLLNNKIEILEKDKQRFDALVKLHDCNQLVNITFKKEYRRYFNKGKFDYVQNIGDFINDPPEKEDDTYDFWVKIINKYPNSYNLEFRNIYKVINEERTMYGAHYDISQMDINEFDSLMKVVFDDYDTNKQLYENYRNWSFMFPTK